MNCPIQASNYQLINHFPYFFFTIYTYLMMWHLKAKHLFLLYCTVAEWCNTKLNYLTFYNFHFSEIIRFEFSKTSRKLWKIGHKSASSSVQGIFKAKKGTPRVSKNISVLDCYEYPESLYGKIRNCLFH